MPHACVRAYPRLCVDGVVCWVLGVGWWVLGVGCKVLGGGHARAYLHMLAHSSRAWGRLLVRVRAHLCACVQLHVLACMCMHVHMHVHCLMLGACMRAKVRAYLRMCGTTVIEGISVQIRTCVIMRDHACPSACIL